MNYSRLRGGLNAARTAYHRAGDAIARHPYLVRTVVVGTSLVGGILKIDLGV